MNTVCIAGVGNLGSRYLQGLVGTTRPLGIALIDPSEDNIRVARQRWREAGGEDSAHRLLDHADGPFDVAIVATTANVRRETVEALSARAAVASWIVEKPIAQSIADNERIEALVGPKSWVNTPRRAMPWYREIRRRIGGAGMRIAVEGCDWGLACNMLHFVDLARFLTGSEPVDVDVSGLDARWHPAKRPGFSEVRGRIVVRFADGSSLDMHSHEAPGPISLTVDTGDVRWTIDEGAGRCTGSNGEIVEGEIAYLSGLTGRIVDDILDRGDCELPWIGPMAAAERLLLRALLVHWEADGGEPGRIHFT